MEEFKKLIKADIKCLTKALNSEPFEHQQIARLNPKDNIILNITPHYVQYLLDKYCFVEKSTTLFSGNRMMLFKDLFIKDVNDLTISYYKGTHVGNIEKALILCFITSLFTKSLLDNSDLDKLIRESLDLWRKSLKTEELPVKFYIRLKGMLCKNTIEINDKCCIEKIDELCEVSENTVISNSSFYAFFSMNNTLKIKYVKYRNQKYFTQDYREKWDKVIQWLFALYLSGYIFAYNEIEILMPWWIWNPLESLDPYFEFWSIKKPISTHDFEFFGIVSFEKEDVNKVNNYHTLIKNSKILENEKFSLIISRYFKMFTTNSIQNMILDAFILLESIFISPQQKGEVTFRLSLNIAFFISADKSEFEEIFKFIKTFYGIRSKIAHGQTWLKNLQDKRKGYRKFFNEDIRENEGKMTIELFRKLKSYIDRALLKIMCWKLKHNKNFLIESENSLFFLNNSIFVKEKS